MKSSVRRLTVFVWLPWTQTIGTGRVVAIQNFAENGFMFVGVLLFLGASWAGVPVTWSMTANRAFGLMIVASLNYLRELQN